MPHVSNEPPTATFGRLWSTLGIAVLLVALIVAPVLAHAQDVAPLRSNVVLRSGLKLSYLEWGSAQSPPLLMLHGKGSGAAELAVFAARLAQRFHVVAVDTRGCGFSDWAPDGNYTVESTVEDLDQFVAAMGWGRFAIYGHSLGAVTAIAYAATHPEHTRLLMLEDGGPTTLADGSLPALNPGQASPAGAPAAMPVDVHYASWDDMRASQSAAYPPPAPLVLESRFVRHADGSVHRRADTVGWWKTQRGEAFTHPWPLVRKLAAPTLLIRADHGLLPEPIAREMVQANPRIRYVTVGNSGHNIHAAHQDEVVGIVDAFWQQHADAR